MTTVQVAVAGRPSKDRAAELIAAEEERMEMQVKQLGPAGLQQAGQRVEQAIASQELPSMKVTRIQISDKPDPLLCLQVLERIPLGDVDTIQFREFHSYNRTLNSDKLFDFSDIPFKIHIDDVNSNFVQLYLFFNTAGLSEEQRELLPLLLDLWLVSPIKKVNKIVNSTG